MSARYGTLKDMPRGNMKKINHSLQRENAAKFQQSTSKKVSKAYPSLNLKTRELKSKIGSYSDYLEVVNALGYAGDTAVSHPRVRVYNDLGEEIGTEHKYMPTSKLVGFIIRNISEDKDIKYITEEFSESKSQGVWQGQRIQRILKPGETAQISKFYFNMLLFMPEFNCRISNGNLRYNGNCGLQSSQSDEAEIIERLNRYYFVSKGGAIHRAGYKIEIATEVGGAYKIKPEYEKIFGSLNSIQPKGRRSAKFKRASTAAEHLADVLDL